MSESPNVAIVDYGMGNLFSVKHACEKEGLRAEITHARSDVLAADAVILPGVGAFGNAMETLHRLDLVTALREVAQSSKPLLGICLGMQLLMTESFEFGRNAGLGILPGTVVRLDQPRSPKGLLKVPEVGWNQLHQPAGATKRWAGTLLEGLQDGVYMYFVHSYVVRPERADVVCAVTRYGDQEFCSALSSGNIFACQCHPERSGHDGLKVYRNLSVLLGKNQSHARG